MNEDEILTASDHGSSSLIGPSPDVVKPVRIDPATLRQLIKNDMKAKNMSAFAWAEFNNVNVTEVRNVLMQKFNPSKRLYEIFGLKPWGRLTTKRRKCDDQLEILALRLYDRFNPDHEFKINMSKQKCIDMAQDILSRRAARVNLRGKNNE